MATKLATDAAGLGRARGGAFVAPALVLIAIFLVFPALWTIYLGLTDYRLTGAAAAHPQFVGTQNYTDALNDPSFHQLAVGDARSTSSARRSSGRPCSGFAMAWMLRGADRRSGRGGDPGAARLDLAELGDRVPVDRDARPHGGTLNALLDTPGTAWLLQYPMACIIVFNIWRGTAFSMLLFSAALQRCRPRSWRRRAWPAPARGHNSGTWSSRTSEGTS